MSVASEPATGRHRLVAWWVAAVVVLLATIVVAGRPRSERPLDPGSAGPEGLLGVVELLTALGVDVSVDLEPPSDPDARVFVPLDLLGEGRRSALIDWVDAGGTLVVAGSDARTHGLEPAGAAATDLLGAAGRTPGCDALTQVGEVVHDDWRTMRVPPSATGCFGEDEAAWMVVRRQGRGTIVALGSAQPLTNSRLDRADNAVLAAALLAPQPGQRVVIVPRPPIGEGDATLLELVPNRVLSGLALAVAAAVVAVVWRSRRLGPPVVEVLPPTVPSAELTRSIGGLLERARDRQAAADELRAGCREALGRALGVPRAVPELAELAATRLEVGSAPARTALVDAPVVTDQDLVAVAGAVRAVRHAAATGRADADL